MKPTKSKSEGMREDELREAAHCILCRQPFGHAGPLFWRIKLERHGLDQGAVSRQDGLTTMLGGHAGLARAMGSNAVMTKIVSTRVCELCASLPTDVYTLGLAEGDI